MCKGSYYKFLALLFRIIFNSCPCSFIWNVQTPVNGKVIFEIHLKGKYTIFFYLNLCPKTTVIYYLKKKIRKIFI